MKNKTPQTKTSPIVQPNWTLVRKIEFYSKICTVRHCPFNGTRSFCLAVAIGLPFTDIIFCAGYIDLKNNSKDMRQWQWIPKSKTLLVQYCPLFVLLLDSF